MAFYHAFDSNVPTERLDEVSGKLMEILRSVAEGEEEDAFDLVRMKNEVRRKITTTLNQFEDDPHEHIAGVYLDVNCRVSAFISHFDLTDFDSDCNFNFDSDFTSDFASC